MDTTRGKSLATKGRAAQTTDASKRPVGKARRPSVQTADDDDDEFKPWRTAMRPACAAPPQDNSFCLDDEQVALTTEIFMNAMTVSDPCQKTNPLVFVSPGFEVLSAYSADELLGANCRLMQGKTPDKEKVSEFSAGLAERRFTSVEITNYRKDGRAFQNLVCVQPVLDAYDNLLKFVGVQCDLDEKRKREHVDELWIAKWAEQVRHYMSAFMITDPSSDSAPILAASTGFVALTGYSQTDVMGCSCLCLCGPDSSVKNMKKLVMSHWSDKPTAVKLLLYKKDGSPFWAYLFTCPLSGDGRSGGQRECLVVLVDITTSRLKRVGKWVLGKVIGSGASGLVRVGKNPATDEIVAVKAVDASRFRSISEIEQIQEEMNVLSSLKHPNIIRLFEVHFINNVFFLVMEFGSGGSLVKYIYNRCERHCLEEEEAHRLFLQMASALDYCHRRRIIHRDLKPENILMDDKSNIKIADFGLAAVTAPFGRGLTQQCGTPEFAAPEIITGKEYDGPAVDIWSMGVILYEALSGTLPFKGSTQAALFKAIQRGVYESLPSHISSDCRDLVRRMLTVEATQRATMEEILRHPWVRADKGSGDEEDGLAPDRSMQHLLLDSGGSFHRRSTTGTLSQLPPGSAPPYISGDLTSDYNSALLRTSSLAGGMYDEDTPGRSEHMTPSGLSGEFAQGPMMEELRHAESLGGTSLCSNSQRVSNTGGFHDSVRVVINDADKDDPIYAAIMRAKYGADFLHKAGLSNANDEASDTDSIGSMRVNPTAKSYSVGTRLQHDLHHKGQVSPGAVGRDLTPNRMARTDGGGGGGTTASPLRGPRRVGGAGTLPPVLGAEGRAADRRRSALDYPAEASPSTRGPGGDTSGRGGPAGATGRTGHRAAPASARPGGRDMGGGGSACNSPGAGGGADGDGGRPLHRLVRAASRTNLDDGGRNLPPISSPHQHQKIGTGHVVGRR